MGLTKLMRYKDQKCHKPTSKLYPFSKLYTSANEEINNNPI